MKFLIRKASDWMGDDKPCNGAEVESSGDYNTETLWNIEINTLEELLEIAKTQKWGVIVGQTLGRNNTNSPFEIILYDSLV